TGPGHLRLPGLDPAAPDSAVTRCCRTYFASLNTITQVHADFRHPETLELVRRLSYKIEHMTLENWMLSARRVQMAPRHLFNSYCASRPSLTESTISEIQISWSSFLGLMAKGTNSLAFSIASSEDQQSPGAEPSDAAARSLLRPWHSPLSTI